MLRSELVIKLQKKFPSLSHNDLEKIMDFFFKRIFMGFNENKKIELRGFGTFQKKINKEKYVRNPKTNEKIFKKKSSKIHFKIGKIFHERINNN